MLTGAKPAIAPLQVLLVGDREEDFFLIRDMLERNRSLIAVELEHARSLDEARDLLQRRTYGLDHKVVDPETNFLQKPYTLKELSSKIRATLDSRRPAPASN